MYTEVDAEAILRKNVSEIKVKCVTGTFYIKMLLHLIEVNKYNFEIP
jgi:hypothetical protein